MRRNTARLGFLVAAIHFATCLIGTMAGGSTAAGWNGLEARAAAQTPPAKESSSAPPKKAGAKTPAPAAEQAPALSAAAYLPDTLFAVAVLREGDKQTAAFRALLEEQKFEETPLHDLLMAGPELAPARIALMGLAASAGTDAWSAVGALLGRELAIGLAPGKGKEPAFILVAVAREPALVDRLLQGIYAVAGLSRGAGEPNPQKSEKIGDVTVYSLNKDALHCRLGRAIILTNSRELLNAALDAHARGKNRLLDAPRYGECLKQVPANAAAWGYADMATIREKLTSGKPLPAQLPNPLGGFLFGGWWHTLRNADSAVFWVVADKGALKISTRTETATPLPETHRGLVPQNLPPAGWPAARLPRFVAEFSVTRGWADLFSEREALLELPAAGDLVNFTNTMTTLMGGLDFMDEFLPKVNGPVRLVLGRQDFSLSQYDPTPKLPSFALVIPLKLPSDAEFARRLHSASQSAMSILNLDAGQKKEPQFLIDIDRYKGYRVLQAEYPAPSGEGMRMEAMSQKRGASAEKEAAAKEEEPAQGRPVAADKPRKNEKRQAGIRYNFAPAAALVEDQYVIATSLDLLHHVIDAISDAKKEKTSAAKPTKEPPADFLAIAVPEVVKLLRENREELVTNQMLEKDKTRAAAEKDMDALFAGLDFFNKLEIRSHCTGREARATLTLSLREKK